MRPAVFSTLDIGLTAAIRRRARHCVLPPPYRQASRQLRTGAQSLVGGLLLLWFMTLGISVGNAQLQRVANTTLALPATPPVFGYSVTNAFGSLNFFDPVCIASPPGETNRLFVVEHVGNIAVITNLAAPTRTVFLSISNKVTYSDEGGLLAMTFHPGYATNGYFYVWYYGPDTTSAGTGPHNILAQYQVSPPSANSAATATEVKLIRQYDEWNNHNGADLHFGPDGYLYVSLGDEGLSGSQFNNDQRIDKDFFSGLLRIDVDKRPGSLPPNPHPAATTNYAVPPDNPFVGATNFNGSTVNPANVRTEFWAVGLRNPWRFTFDPASGLLYLGDVGEETQEEVNVIAKGGNYGWAYREGLTNGPKSAPVGFTSAPPVLTYTHGFATNQGYCIIGGLVYQGNNLSQLVGAYVFGDNVSGNLWSLRYDGTNVTQWQRLGSAVGLSTFGTDPRNGDILLATRGVEGSGDIVQPLKRLVYSTNFVGQPLPPTLADTGAFTNLATLAPAPGVVAYGVNHPFWSDNALKQRWFSVPNTNLTIGFNSTDNWTFPTGSVWIKHFDLQLTNGAPAQRIETRLLVKNAAGVYGVTYRWGSSLTNATLVPEGGLDENFVIDEGGGLVRTQSWHYPGRQECQACHTALGGHALSFNTAQLNRTNSFGNFVTNQIQALSDAGYFSSPVTNLSALPALASLTEPSVSTEVRVRSYLAANCVQCHQPGGLAMSLWDARFTTPTAQAGLINGALANNFGNTNIAVIKPGVLTNSVLWSRVANLGPGHMPPLATSVINAEAVQLLSEWITNDLAYPILTLTPTGLNLSAVVGNNPTDRTLGITNGGSGMLNWTAEAGDPAWLTISPTNGFGNGPVNLAVASSNLPIGSYTNSITVTAPGATNSPQTLIVTLTITASNQPPVANNDNYTVAANATLNVSAPGILSNDTDPDENPLTAILVGEPGHGALSLNANGAFVYTPTASYSGPDSFTYKANDGSADSAVTTVNLTVTPPPPILTISPTTLNFTVTQGANPANQLITITNSGGGTLNWTAIPDAAVPAWLTLNPTNGTGNSTISIAVGSASLAPGNYTKGITVTAVGASNSPQIVTVNLTVTGGSGTNRYDFTYTNRAALLAAGWDFVARTAASASRNTEQTTGAVVDYNQTTHPGVLRIPVDTGDLWLEQNTSRNTLFRDVPTNWTSLRLKFSFAPTQNYQQAGLVVYQNDDTYVQLTRMHNGGQRISFVRESGGAAAVIQSATVTTTTNLHFRLDRDSTNGLISSYYSLNNTNWTAVGSVVQTISNPRLCIFVGASPSGLPNADLIWAEVIAPYTPPANPILSVTPITLNFSKTYGTIPAAQSFGIANIGGGTLSWTAAGDAAAPGWLTVNPASGTGNATVSVSITNANLNSGNYVKAITVTAPGATNSPQSVTVNLSVNPATPLVATKPTAAVISYGQPLSAATLSGGTATNAAGVTVSGAFTFTAPATIPNAGITSQGLTFTPSDSTNYITATTTLNVTVNPAIPLIASKPTAAVITYGQPLSTAALSGGTATNAAGASVPGTFTFTTPTTVPNAGVATHSLTFTPTDSVNYTTATTTLNVTVNPATPLIATTPTASVITYGQALSAATLSGGTATNAAGAAVPGTFAFTTPATIPNAGITTHSLIFTPTDPVNYHTATTTLDVTINPAALNITANAASKIYDGLPYAGGNGVTYAGFVNEETEAVLAGSLSYGGPAQGAINAGSYSIVPAGRTATNYAINYVSGTLTVQPFAVTVTAEAQTKVYGSADPELSYQVNPALISGDSFSGALARVPGESVGTYAITQGTLTNTNYAITYQSTNLTITGAPLTITANNTNKGYGQTASFTGTEFTTDGLLGADSVTSASLSSDGTPGAATVGSYSINVSAATGSGLDNYSISYVPGTLTVGTAVLTITAHDQSRTYGATNPEFTVTYSGFVNGESLTNSDVAGAPGLGTLAGPNSAVGTYEITNTIGTLTSTNYTFDLTNGTLTINPTPLTITANATSKIYDGLPYTGGSGVTYDGFVNAETEAVLTGSVSYGGTAQGAINVGSYSIVPASLTATNYAISYVNGTLDVTALEVTVTAEAQTKVYGSADPELSYQVNPALIGGDNFSGTLARTPGESVGDYAIAQGSLILNTNYSLNYVGTNLTIAPAPLIITAHDGTKGYGQTASFAGTEFTTAGLVGEDSVTSAALSSDGTSSAAIVGSYPIIASNATGSGLANYTVSYLAGTLTVQAAGLTVTPDNQTRTYGATNPVFTVTYSGFVNGESLTNSDVAGAPVPDTAADRNSIVGVYEITNSLGSLTSTNYTFNLTQGALTVTPAPLTIIANDASKAYDGLPFHGGNGVSYQGFVNEETETVLGGSLGYDGSAQGAVPAGSYTITPSGLTANNYAINYVSGNLTITRAALTITAHHVTKGYGQTLILAETAFSADGLLGEDSVTSASLSSDGMMNTAAAGPYPISISAATGSGLDNYSISYVPGTLTVGAAVLTVTADDQSRTYGATNPEFTVTYNGFVNGESFTNSDVAGAPEVGTLADVNSMVGTYEITNTIGSLTSTNYTFNLTNGTLTINPAPLSITANDASKVYDGLPYVGRSGVTYDGFVNAETEAVLASSLSYGGTAQGAINVGSYSIVPTGLTATNYAISYVSSTLTVQPFAVIVTAEAQTKVYGSADPELSYQVNPALISGDNFSGTLVRTPGEGVGNYAIAQASLSLDGNYSLSYIGTNLTITSAPLTITAHDASKAYGLPMIFAGTEFTAAGLVGEDSVTSAALSSDGTPSAATAGSYPITVSSATGSGLDNYSISYPSGTLTVGTAVLTITADDQSRSYGATNPVFTVTYSGFVNGESLTNSDVTGAPELGTLADVNSTVGTYEITNNIGSLTSTNYTFTLTNGMLTISPAPLSIAANDASKVYDGLPYVGGNGVTYDGFVNEETEAVLAGSLSYGGTAQGAINIGSYSIVPAGLTATNYAISYLSSTLTVQPFAVTVTAEAQTKVYGSADPELSYQVSPALISGDSFSGALTRNPGESVGNYAIAQGSLILNTNYSLSYIGTNLTITPAPLTITAHDVSKAYGLPMIFAGTEFTAAGLLGEDSVTSAALSSDGTSSAATVGSYPININAATGSGLDNYTNTYAAGTLTVIPPTPVVIGAPVVLADNNIQLTFTGGDAGVSYRIEVSPDLSPTNWSALTTNLAGTNGLPAVTDRDATNHAQRFYRTTTP